MGAPPKKSKLPWVIGSIAAVAVIAAVVLVLVFVVFKGDGGEGTGDGKAGSDAQAIEKVVNVFFESIEKQDVDGILGVIEPDFLDELKDALGRDYKKTIKEDWLYWFEGVEFDLRKLDVKIDGDKAEEKIVEGTVNNVVDFGAFVVLDDGIEGLLHVSEMADGTLTEPYSYVKRGDRVIMRIVRIEPEEKRIGFTQRDMGITHPVAVQAEDSDSATGAAPPTAPEDEGNAGPGGEEDGAAVEAE
mgnify:CR=1 FL=1